MNANLFGVIGMVGVAGCIGIGSTFLRENYKEREAEKDLSVDESDEQEALKENEKVVTEFPKESMLVDKNKLKDILIKASYPADRVDEFVNLIATQAKAESKKVVAEEISPDSTTTEKKPEGKDGFVKVSFENLK